MVQERGFVNPDCKGHRLSFRLAREDVELIDHAATLRGSSRTEFMRAAAVRLAESVILERNVIRMSSATFREFLDAVDAQGRNVPELVKVFKHKSPWNQRPVSYGGSGAE
jgi:uncharacterized protein (DUF1778 family)